MAPQTLLHYLDKNQISYTTIRHPEMISEKLIKSLTHNEGNGLAKAVMVRDCGGYILMVIPAMHELDCNLLCKSLGIVHIELVTPKDSQKLFPEYEADVMPPFGNLVGIRVYIDEELTGNEYIAFNVGNHHEVIMISYSEFARLVKPTVISFQDDAQYRGNIGSDCHMPHEQ